MAEPQIRFDDGVGYERYMGIWSRLAGSVFLDWMAPERDLRWLDVGCGNGAFTELLVERCAPAAVEGVDPSEAQLAFARTRPAGRVAQFRQGDATHLPFPNNTFDAAVMALVIFFIRDTVEGVTEMARVVRPGGVVGAYVWDIPGGGLPAEPVHAEMRTLGMRYPVPPASEVSRIDRLGTLWSDTGLAGVQTREIAVTRTFQDFDDFWAVSLLAPSLGPVVAALATEDVARLKDRVRERLPADASGRITYVSRANAVKGQVPG